MRCLGNGSQIFENELEAFLRLSPRPHLAFDLSFCVHVAPKAFLFSYFIPAIPLSGRPCSSYGHTDNMAALSN